MIGTERHAGRSASGERCLLTYSYVGGDLSPLISRLRDSFHPKGKPFCKISFALHDKAISGSNIARSHPSPTALNCFQFGAVGDG